MYWSKYFVGRLFYIPLLWSDRVYWRTYLTRVISTWFTTCELITIGRRNCFSFSSLEWDNITLNVAMFVFRCGMFWNCRDVCLKVSSPFLALFRKVWMKRLNGGVCRCEHRINKVCTLTQRVCIAK